MKYIKANFGDKFGISVAGYPEGHPVAITEVQKGELDSLSDAEKLRLSKVKDKEGTVKYFVCRDDAYKMEMEYLKSKVDAGADFIITQMFFDHNVYSQFVKDCKAWGINCKVVPGIMCINNYGGFMRMTGLCKTRVPEPVMEFMESIKDNEEALKKFGVSFGVELCKHLVECGAPCVHFYTLNLERVVYGILDGLGWSTDLSSKVEEADSATTGLAAGSKWAREGDEVTSMFGLGIVKEIRKDGSAVIDIKSWKLAGGQQPLACLAKGSFKKKN